MRKAIMATLILAVFAMPLSGPLMAAPPRYYFRDLGTLPGGSASAAEAINNAGQITGWSAVPPHGDSVAFLKNPHQPMENLGTLGGNQSFGYGINNAGQVVGLSYDGSMVQRAFLKNPGEAMQDLGTLGGVYAKAFNINDAGQVVGSSPEATGYLMAFLKNPGEAMTSLGTLDGLVSEAFGINSSGWVVGRAPDVGYNRAFLKKPGEAMVSQGTLGGDESWANAINDSGAIVGWSDNAADQKRAFRKFPTRDMVDLGDGEAFGVNSAGWVVGTSESGRAFLVIGLTRYDLNDLTVNLPAGIELKEAKDINDKGWIVGQSTYNAFLLTPLSGYVPLGLLLD
jgi:probable HAF family extracellular repeat protein